jgi:hypothetical protein
MGIIISINKLLLNKRMTILWNSHSISEPISQTKRGLREQIDIVSSLRQLIIAYPLFIIIIRRENSIY